MSGTAATTAASLEQQSPGGKALVVGLGRTGLSCVRYLVSQGWEVAVTDSRPQPPELEQLRAELPDLALFLGGFREDVFAAARQLIVSPGVPIAEPLVQAALARGVPVLGDIELFARATRAPVVAITGSNGKSTVTTLVGEMARAAGCRIAVGGNLGRPALDLLADEVEIYVLELSSFQLETAWSLTTRAAAVLNVSPDHMDRYRSLPDYVGVKARIYARAEMGVINRDDPWVREMTGIAGQDLGFTLAEPAGGDFGTREQGGERWLCQGEERLLPIAALRLPGRHNQANALAALALGAASGLPREAMLAALRGFAGLPHRTQLVAERGGVRWYDDSKGTNVGATMAALEGLDGPGPGRTLLIAGGDCKGADFAPLAPVVARTCAALILIGRDADRIADAVRGQCRLLRAASLEEAVRRAAETARPGDQVLLSPACASFDMFQDFRERGEAFVAAVTSLRS